MAAEVDTWIAEFDKTKPACSKCNSKEHVIPVARGRPGPHLLAAAEQGKVHLGGCCISPGQPNIYCKQCGE